MDRSSPESEPRKRGLRETLRLYWMRVTTAIRGMFASKQEETEDRPAPVCRSHRNSLELVTKPAKPVKPVVADALSASGVFIRQWEQVDDKKPCPPTFRVVSYNILSQRSVETMPELYKNLEKSTWSDRWELLEREIIALKADILALQEVTAEVYKRNVGPLLQKLNYEFLYFEKTMATHHHGLVLAVKRTSFKIESFENVEFFQKEDTVLEFGNIGQIVRVFCWRTGASLLLAHTHLLFDPSRGDTKLAQIAYLLSRIHQYRRENEPILCLGDFNIEPDSGLYGYITNGILNVTGFSVYHGSGQIPANSNEHPKNDFLYQLPRETFLHTMMDRTGEIQADLYDLIYSLNTVIPNQMTHRLSLTSVYAPHEPSTVSSFRSGKACPDYIFYDAGSTLSLIRRLALPSVVDLCEADNWPNQKVPSDHICLLAEFAFTVTY